MEKNNWKQSNRSDSERCDFNASLELQCRIFFYKTLSPRRLSVLVLFREIAESQFVPRVGFHKISPHYAQVVRQRHNNEIQEQIEGAGPHVNNKPSGTLEI